MATRIIVVGAGSIGRRHAENLTALGAEVEHLGWRGLEMPDLVRRLTRGVDGMVIATATQVRLALIRAAAEAGVPVYVEKPLAFTPDGVAAVLEAAGAVAERSLLGVMMRWHPAFRALAQADLSDTFRFDMTIGHDVTQWRQNWRFSQSYAAEASGGGVLLDLCHELDMACCLFPGLTPGPVESTGHAAYPGVDMASRILLSAPGISGSVSMDYLAPALIRDTRICGTRATRHWDFAAQDYRIITAAGTQRAEHPLERNAMFLDAMRDWLALIAGHAPSSVEHLPRLTTVGESCHLIARAWQMRRFIGQTAKEIP